MNDALALLLHAEKPIQDAVLFMRVLPDPDTAAALNAVIRTHHVALCAAGMTHQEATDTLRPFIVRAITHSGMSVANFTELCSGRGYTLQPTYPKIV